MNSKFVCNILSEKITTSYLSCPFMTATILLTGCEFLSEQDKEEVKHELEPHELIIGSWSINQVIMDYNYCDWGTGDFNHYNNYDLLERTNSIAI